MPDNEELWRALSTLPLLRLSREEKLRRIDDFFGTVPQAQWKNVFALMRDVKELYLNLLTIEDSIILLVKFKDYKGLHQLKQRIYLLAATLPFLFNIHWRRFPLGIAFKGQRPIRRSLINPLPGDLYTSLGNLVRRKGLSVNEVYGTDIIRRGEKYGGSLDGVYRKLAPYPNVRSYLLRELDNIARLQNGEAEKEVKKIEQELRPLYLRLDQPTFPTQAFSRFGRIIGEVLEQALKISQCCARSEEEGKSLEMGMIIGDHDKVMEMLSMSLIERISADLFLREEEWVRIRREVSRKADGVASTLIVNGEDGHILDVRTMGKLTYYDITSRTDSVAFKISQNCARIISGGELQFQLILNRKIGQWSLRDVQQAKEVIKKIAIEKSLDCSILNRIIEIAFEMSEAKEASLFVVGKFSELERCLTKRSTEKILKLRTKNILDIPENELINYSREDGAIIIDENGMLRDVEAYFTGGGGRHEIARYVTQRCPKSVSIVVSKDATTSIYDKGDLRQEIL